MNTCTGESSTIGGLLCAEAGRIPRPGDQIPFAQYLFTVLQVEDNRLILSVRAQLLDPGNAAAGDLGNNPNSDMSEAFHGTAWEPDGDSDQINGRFEDPTPTNSAYHGNINGNDNGNTNAFRMSGDVVASSVYDRTTFPDVVAPSGADVSNVDINGSNSVSAEIANPSSGASSSTSTTVNSNMRSAVRGKRVFVEGTWIEDWFNADD